MNEIVKIHNDFTNENLGKMNAKELDLFMTICHKMRDKGTCEVTISFDELRTLGHYNKNSNKELKNELLRANEKLLEFKILIEQGAKTKQRTLFKEFVTDMDALTVTCEVWEELVYILTGVVKNFTRFEAQLYFIRKYTCIKDDIWVNKLCFLTYILQNMRLNSTLVIYDQKRLWSRKRY